MPLLQEWELRDRYQQYDDGQQQYLVEEVDSDEDEMIEAAYNERDRTPTRMRGGMYDMTIHEGEQDYYFSDEEPRNYSPPARDREREREILRDEVLMEAAYARIARAREKGKTNVSLTQEEMQALERGRLMEGRRTSGPHQALERRTFQLPEPSSALATPPITPAAAISSKAKDKVKAGSSRSSSAASLASVKKGGRKSTGMITSPAKSNSKAKVMRKGSMSMEQQPPIGDAYPQAPPGMRLVNGPHGIPVYAPVEYPSLSGRGSPSMSRSRSGSQHRRDSMTPPRVGGEYPPTSISTRYRPGSSSSLRDDGEMAYDWYGPGRQRSVSNARSYQNLPYGYEYGERPISRQRGDHYAEPVRYANLRRVPPMSPAVAGRDRNLQRVPTNGSSDSSEGSEEQGVRVEVSAVDGGGYAVRRGEEEEEPEVLSDAKKKVKGKDLSKYSGSVRKRKAGKK